MPLLFPLSCTHPSFSSLLPLSRLISFYFPSSFHYFSFAFHSFGVHIISASYYFTSLCALPISTRAPLFRQINVSLHSAIIFDEIEVTWRNKHTSQFKTKHFSWCEIGHNMSPWVLCCHNWFKITICNYQLMIIYW